mmetsp:Transcript_13923/g.52200  ORF Transcript_13923/g.52200 Transcript_13923/m.52200 type:complete len:184 (-) Transcript_13923:71-622(-)
MHAVVSVSRTLCVSVRAVTHVGVSRTLRCRVSNHPTTRVRTRTVAMAAPGDEQQAALEAHLKGMANPGAGSFFDKIVDGSVPADIIHEDNLCMAFRDIAPQAKTHFLVIPKIRAGLTQLSKATDEHKFLLGHLLFTAQAVAKQEKLENGFRVVINDGVEGCQSVYHLHVHVIGGQQLSWPPGC